MVGTKGDISIGIPDFFKGKSLFITGFTGFIGQLLVEKLLFSCPDLEQIYVLVRNKKGEDPLERGQKVINSRTFDRVREKNPDLLKTKITIFPGDIKEDMLGLSKEHHEILKHNVNIIIHGAATVKFNETLNDALQMNTKATMRIVNLALTMPHLICLTYMSTAYSNCYQQFIKEELYPPKASWRNSLSIIQKLDPAVVQILHHKYIEGFPNTYTFTKHLAEFIIDDYKHILPVVIVRPSVVVCASKEPQCGWTGLKYGAGGLMIGYLTGILRCNYMRFDNKLNCIFSDIVVNATLVATWKKNLSSNHDANEDLLPIYNICEPSWYSLTNKEYIELHSKTKIIDHINENRINFFRTSFMSSLWSFKLNNLYKHVLPAFIVDQMLKLTGKTPLLLKLRKKVFLAILVLAFFIKRMFYFNTKRFDSLVNDMTPEDRETFGWDFTKCDIYEIYYRAYLHSTKTFLKPLFDDLDTNRRRLLMLYALDISCVFFTYSLTAWILYKISIPHLLLNAAAGFFMLK